MFLAPKFRKKNIFLCCSTFFYFSPSVMYIYKICFFYFLIKLFSLMCNEMCFVSILGKALWHVHTGSMDLSITVAILIYSPTSISTQTISVRQSLSSISLVIADLRMVKGPDSWQGEGRTRVLWGLLEKKPSMLRKRHKKRWHLFFLRKCSHIWGWCVVRTATGWGQHRMSETRDDQSPKIPNMQQHDWVFVSISSDTTLPRHSLKRDYKLLSCSSQFDLELRI